MMMMMMMVMMMMMMMMGTLYPNRRGELQRFII